MLSLKKSLISSTFLHELVIYTCKGFRQLKGREKFPEYDLVFTAIDLILIYFHWPRPFIWERMYESFSNVRFSYDSFFAMFNFLKGPMNWERVPSEKEKTCHSKAWFTVKKDTVHIKTKTFSFWSVFCCGGPKRKRATVFVSKPNPGRNLLHLRFYIYSDNEDSRKVWSGVIVRSVYHMQGKTTLDSMETPIAALNAT